MDLSRRALLQIGCGGAISSLAGCNFEGGPSEYAPIVVENNHDAVHAVSIAILTPPEGSGGYTEYFSKALQIQSGEEETFDKGLAFTDYEPNLLAMVMIDDETTMTSEFSFDFDLQKLQVQITDAGQIQISPLVAT